MSSALIVFKTCWCSVWLSICWYEFCTCRFELGAGNIEISSILKLIVQIVVWNNRLERLLLCLLLIVLILRLWLVVSILLLVLLLLILILWLETVVRLLRALGKIGHMRWGMSRGLWQSIVVSTWLLESKDRWVCLLKFCENFLAMLYLHQRWLERLDSVQDFFS